jgi:hypothetical protein
MEDWASKILHYMSFLDYSRIKVPEGIGIMNPYAESENIRRINKEFYNKYYSDNNQRIGILGINPGRLGAGATGIPFTDTKRLAQYCNILAGDFHTHEPSSVFIYDMIAAYGGPDFFFSKYYITSAFPLGFTNTGKSGKVVNYNYYDQKDLQELVRPYIISHLRTQISFGLNTDIVFCLGSGKNYNFLKKLNDQEKMFALIEPLEHPRFVMQYKLKLKENYISDYLSKLSR